MSTVRYCLFIVSLIMLFGFASALTPTALFNGTPTSGTAYVTVSFTDQSIGSPTGWAWYFGDETYMTPWTQITASAGWTGRFSHSSVVMPDGSIVLMGGDDNLGYKNDTWRSTDNGATWIQVNASSGWPARGYHSSLVMPDSSIVLMGGAYSFVRMNDVWRSTDNGSTWALVNASAGWSAREGQSSVVMPDGSIVLMGGTDINGFKNDTWRSMDNGATWKQVNASSGWSRRSGHSSVVMPDGSIVLMGGYFYNDTWRSTDNGTTWQQMNASSGWTGRFIHSSVAMPDGSIILIGGADYNGYKNDTWQSMDNGASWNLVNAASSWSARGAHSSVVMPDGGIVLMGGGSMNDTWRFMPAGSSVQNPVHTYITPGTYQVTLQVYNADGYNSTRKTGYITVNARPVPNFTGTPRSGTAPLTVTFTDSSTNSPTSWNWSFGDGVTSENRNPVHTYTTAGTYTVCLRVTCAGGAIIKIYPNYITVVSPVPATPAPVANFTGTPRAGNVPLTVSFGDLSTNTPTGWTWFFGDENYTEPWMQQTASAGWSERYGHTSVAMPDGSIVLMGGYVGGLMNDVWRSTNNGSTWQRMTANAGWSGRSSHTSIVMPDSSIVLMGGGIHENDVWRSMDYGATWQQMTSNAGWSGRSGHTSVVMPDSSIVLMGGLDSHGINLNDVWRSTDYGATWTQMTASAGWSPRSFHSSVVMPDSSIVLMGGDAWKNDVWRSTDNGATWTEVNANAGWSGRSGHTGQVMPDGSIMLMGGISSTGYRNDVWRSTDNGANWVPLTMSSPWSSRFLSSSVVLPDSSIVLTGGRINDGSASINDVWRFVLTGSSAQNPTHTYTTPGTYQVSLQVSKAEGYNSTRKTGYISVWDNEGSDSGDNIPSTLPSNPSTGNTITETVNVGGGSAVSRAGVTGTNLGKNLVVTAFPRNNLPSDIAITQTRVYQYISVVSSMIPGVVDQTTLEFSVPQSWLTEHGFTAGDIVMMHYDNRHWQELDTRYVSQNAGNVFYRATTPGFSYFAIVYQKDGTEMGIVTSVPTAVPTQVIVLKAPVQEAPSPVEITRKKTPALPPAPATQPSRGIPITTIIVGTTGAIATVIGTVLIRRWWIRKQNPTLFRRNDRY